MIDKQAFMSYRSPDPLYRTKLIMLGLTLLLGSVLGLRLHYLSGTTDRPTHDSRIAAPAHDPAATMGVTAATASDAIAQEVTP